MPCERLKGALERFGRYQLGSRFPRLTELKPPRTSLPAAKAYSAPACPLSRQRLTRPPSTARTVQQQRRRCGNASLQRRHWKTRSMASSCLRHRAGSLWCAPGLHMQSDPKIQGQGISFPWGNQHAAGEREESQGIRGKPCGCFPKTLKIKQKSQSLIRLHRAAHWFRGAERGWGPNPAQLPCWRPLMHNNHANSDVGLGPLLKTISIQNAEAPAPATSSGPCAPHHTLPNSAD